jgi:phosphate transport system protein
MTQHPDQPHTIQAFDDDLNAIRALVRDEGDLAASQVLAAVDAMVRRDLAAAIEINMVDERVDQLRSDAEQLAITTIGRRAPMADDLREIIAAIKIAGELERVGDYAKNIAKRIPAIAETSTVEPAVMIPNIAELVVTMVRDAITCYLTRDADLAVEVIQRDRSVDGLYNSLFRSLLVYMIENPQRTTQSAHLLFVAKNLERVGDHATNIADMVYYSVTGQMAEQRLNPVGSAYEPIVQDDDQ